jgi:uncharacterized membrane protein SpoIIM required for sporulation/uncharacterized RDD family membrane protein YckC
MSPAVARNSDQRRGLEDVVAVETPEMVLVSYTIAGVGSRIVAGIIDLLICFAFLISLSLLGWFLTDAASSAKSSTPSSSTSWAFAILALVQFAILWGYYVLFEALRDGQTPGKRIMHLRVVMDAGYSIPFSASAVRNIVRLLDMQPGVFAVIGIVSIAASRSGKRIGDMIAGTMVVKEQPLALNTTARRLHDSRRAPLVPTTALTDAELDVLSRFVNRRHAISSSDRSRLASQLASRFRSRLPADGATDIVFLLRLYETETLGRGQGRAAKGASGAARERHAIMSEGAERWAAFASKLKVAQKRGLSGMSETEVSAFVARYRELSNDLARLRTAARDADPAAVFSLSRLVAAGHNLIYKGRQVGAAKVLEFLAFDVPREVRRSAGAILLSAALFFIPMGIAYRATSSSSSVAAEILPPGMLERAEDGIQRARANRGYIEDPKSARPIMGSMIIANNLTVAFAVFALGITILGSIFALVNNGVLIGGVFGLYQNKGIIRLLLSFVAPHSVLELSAITIAGGAGLLIASAVVIPGNRTRRDALIEKGKRAMSLVTCAILFLLVAGSLEGLVSPIPAWPLAWKVEVAAATLVLMIAYLSLGFRKRPKDLPAT